MKTRGLTQIIGAAILFAAVGCGEAPRLGGDCEEVDAALCDGMQVLLVCDGASWGPPPTDFCECTQGADGSDQASCVVPGFVGIGRAGRLRQPATALRLA